jgi:hypothetical protein
MSFRDIQNENSLNGISFTRPIVFDNNNLTSYGYFFLNYSSTNFNRYE